MSAKTIRKALGTLQDDPEQAAAWAELSEALGFKAVSQPLDLTSGEGAMSAAELASLLEAARRAHESRREFDAVARLLEMEVALAHGSEAETTLQAELARVLDEELFDDTRAIPAYKRLLELRPGDGAAEDAIEKCGRKQEKWAELVAKYAQEAKDATDASFKSSLLVSAAETGFRYGLPQLSAGAKESNKKTKKLNALSDEILSSLKEALELDPKNRRAARLLERIYHDQEKWDDLLAVMEASAREATNKAERVVDYVRLGRLLRKLKNPDRAMRAYEEVLDVEPGHPEATSALVDYFTAKEMWDHLVALYEGQLASQKTVDAGILVQIAMVNWRMRGKLDAAEPYFERLRKMEPAHPGMLQFFREWCTSKGTQGKLVQILTDAQRVMPDGPERQRVSSDLAKLAEEGENAAKAIEQWRAVLRQEPTNAGAREALKRLYRQTSGWNALTDLLRSELEKIPADDGAARLPILREIAEIYRLYIKSDSALVTVLSQIVAIDKDDAEAVRELARVYEALGRWRDLLATQTRLAELETDKGVKTELYRAVARRWLEQFSNVQNAIDLYEKVFDLAPSDGEALEKLKELYGKRRAYRPLYELLDRETAAMPAGPERREIWIEMAKLAAERLDKGADAMKLYKKVLEEDPQAAGALDALEKQAEREKDFATVAEVLEHRAKVAPDDAQKLVILQKLGAIYAERLHDHKGSLRAWRRVLELSPGHAKAMRVLRDSYLAVGDYDGLSELYASHNDYEGLVEVLSAAADRATDADVKVDLSFRSAAIYVENLKTPERAFRAYERVLSVRPNDARAAAALVPIYERDERWARLPALYEALLGHAESDEEKLTLLQKLVQVTGQNLQDKAASFAYARKAYELDPEREGALSAFEKTARASGEWGAFVDSLSERIKAKKVKKGEKRILRAKLAEVCAIELGRVDEAVATYKTLVEEDESDQVAVETLDRILRSADKRDDLRWLFDIRVERAKGEARLALLSEWAVLEEEAFGAPERAVAIYRRMLEVRADHGPALRALARLLRAQGDAAGAAVVLEQDRDLHEGSQRAACEVELARLYMGPLGKAKDALAAGQRALELVPGMKDALDVVEELLKVGETRAQAAVILEASYASAGNRARQAEILEVIIATAASKTDRVKLFARLADVHEQLGAFDRAFDVVVRVAIEFPTELPFWDRLSALAAKTQRAQHFVDAIAAVVPPQGATGLPQEVELELAERAATLYDEKLGEIDHAQPYLQRILAKEPSNERAFSRLKQILTTRDRWDDLEALYERTIAATDDAHRRAELLAEVALIAEEITADRPKATSYYERILEIDPVHEHAMRALDMLYVAESHYGKLAELLKRQLARATTDETTALRLRLGTIYFSQLQDPATALDYLEKVLESDVANREARELVEKCLEVPDLRARAASVLEAVYTARDEVRDLVRVLEIRLEFAKAAAEQRELLARISELRDERLKDDAGAFAAFAKLVPVDPDDGSARSRLLEIGRRLGAHDQTAAVLTAAARAANAPQPRAEILSEVAKIYEDLLRDATRAEVVYREVLDIAPEDATIALPAARSLERLYGASGKSADLAKILKVEVRLEDAPEARRELYGRLGELSETVLDDPRGAIEAYNARLTDDPADERALVALDRLYTRTEDWRALVEILRSREKLATDATARKALMVRIATTLGEKLTDVPEAILAYRAIVDDFGPERPILSALATLYEVADRWTDLGEALEGELLLADTPEDKLAILARLGQVRMVRLSNVEGAIDAYRQALQIHPAHPASRSALEELLANDSARREAAGILRPLYEVDGEHTRLLRVLDIEAEYAESTADKLALYAQAAQVAEGPLGDGGRAFAYASRGLREAAQDAELPQWLERAERLAQLTGSFKDLVDLLKAVIPDILNEDVQLDVTLKVAVLARTKLADRDLAKSYYAKALDLRADDRRALEALESLYEEAGDHTALLDIVRRRVEVAESDAERLGLLFKEARLCDETLKDSVAAITVYERILDLLPNAPDERALDALERLYTTTERWNDLIALYERQIATDKIAPAKKANLHHKLGVVLEKRLEEVERAFDQYDAALAIEPQHPATIASLEGLMNVKEHAARAAEMLEQVYLTRLDWRRVMATLEARLESSQDPDARRQLLRRLAKLHEEQEEDYRAALETTAKLLAQDIADETTWAELERLARVANAEGRLAEIYAGELERITDDEVATAKLAKRTGELFESQKDIDRALVYYRRAYAFAPEENDGSFDAIDRLLRDAKRPADRVALYREALDHRTDPKDRLTTLHTIALLEETELKDDDKAIETFRAAIEIDDSDTHSLEALSRLYARRERWRDLADLVRRRAEQSALPDDEAKFRLELGKLLEQRLGETSQAIDEYQAVVDVAEGGRGAAAAEAIKALETLVHSPEHKARVVEILRPIYERADDWRHLVGVNTERLTLTEDPGERVAIFRETARLWEERGGDKMRAFEAVREAFVVDPEDGETRAELDRLGAATKRWDDLAGAYEQGVEKTDGVSRRELLQAIAKLHDSKRDDPRRALDAWQRVYKLDESDLEALEEMDALASLLSDWKTLVWILVKKADLLSDDEERARTWRRIGEARRDMLDDAPGAIEAYERALELEQDSAFTIDNLLELYEAKNDSARLVDLYRKRVELCGPEDDDRKFDLLVQAANRYEQGLSDRREAITLLGDALAVRPGDAIVTKRLDDLFTQERMWPELLENLRLQIGNAPDEATRRMVKKRVGAVLAKELEDPRQALESYREVLDSADDEAIRAVREIGETHEDLRTEAALALEPVLKGAERWSDLADVYEMRLRAQTDPHDRGTTLRAIADVAENKLNDTSRAADALLRALVEQPDDATLHAEIERVADKLGRGGWEKYAEALAERAGALFDANITSDLFIRLGRVSEERLKDDNRAVKAYVQAAEQAGDTAVVLEALDRLLSRLGDARGLAGVLERRIAIESDAKAQAQLYHRLASLQIREFGEKTTGLATLRLAIECDPNHRPSRESIEQMLEGDDMLFDEAFQALEGVYRQLNQAAPLAKLYERRVARAKDGRERSRARLDLVRVLETEVQDAAQAQRVLEQAVLDDPSDEEALRELERLAPITGGWTEASNAFERALHAARELPNGTKSELWVRLAGWRRDKLGDNAGAEAAFLEALKADAENLETIRSIEALRRAPGRERELVETLRARAKLEGGPFRKEVLREAKTLAETTVHDAALAEATLRDLLADDENDAWALEELTRLREQAGDHQEVVKLLLRRAEAGEDAVALKHRAAKTMLESLGDSKGAIQLFEEILEHAPGDELASAKLRELYEKGGQDKELGKLLVHLIDNASTPEARAALRLDLARLQDAKFSSPKDAADTLRAILDEEPGHAEAVLSLSRLFEKTGQDEELADLLRAQIDLARDRGDAGGELTLEVRLGEVFESRLKDATRALSAYEGVLEKDPAHKGALEAVARLAEARSDWARVATALGKLVELATDSSGVPLALRLAAARGHLEDAEGVEQALKRALELDPKNLDVRGQLRGLYEKAKKWGELAELLVGDASLLASTNGDANMPVIAVSSPPPARGTPSAPPGASSPPPGPVLPPHVAEQVKLLRRAADIHIRERKAPGDAVPLLERASALSPQDRELLLQLCDAYSAAGQEREAAKVLERVIASFGNRRSKELSLYHHRLGRALASLGDKDVALAQFDMAFKIDPGSVVVLKDLGVLALETNDLDRAQKTFRALLLQRLEPSTGITKGEVFYYLGEISAKQGDKAKAVQMLERAIENEPSLDRAKAKLQELKG